MAKSLAFWLVNPKEKDGKKPEIELHFNYWLLKTKGNKRFSGTVTNYLDIGVKFTSVVKFDSIKFYLPFNKDTLKYDGELGKKICSQPEILSTVFNELYYNIGSEDNRGFYDITFGKDDNAKPLRFFTGIQHKQNQGGCGVGISSDSSNGGTIIEFPMVLFCLDNDRESYFRFRIELNESDIKSLSRVYDPKWSLITNYFETCEIIDFRINEARNLPDDVKKELVEPSYIKKVHFFLIRDAKSEYRMSHDAYHRCRILENDIWDKYLGTDIDDTVDSQMLIYHWKEKSDIESIEHFSAFAKFTRRTLKALDVIWIALIIIMLSVIAGWITNKIWTPLQENVQLSNSGAASSKADSLFTSGVDHPVVCGIGVSNVTSSMKNKFTIGPPSHISRGEWSK